MTLWKRRWSPKKATASVEAVAEKRESSDGTAEEEVPAQADWKALYEEARRENESLREESARRELRRQKEKAYEGLLAQCGIPESKREAVLRLCDVEAVELDENGAIREEQSLKEAICAEWSAIIPEEKGPYKGTYPLVQIRAAAPLTKGRIMAIRDRDARRAAIMENMELFR